METVNQSQIDWAVITLNSKLAAVHYFRGAVLDSTMPKAWLLASPMSLGTCMRFVSTPAIKTGQCCSKFVGYRPYQKLM